MFSLVSIAMFSIWRHVIHLLVRRELEGSWRGQLVLRQEADDPRAEGRQGTSLITGGNMEVSRSNRH